MTPSSPRAYRAALWLYPRSFRREFAADLDQCFRDLRQDHGAFSTWRRVVADLARSIPTQHVEVLMARMSLPATKLASGAVVIAAIAGTFIFGRPVVWLPALLIGAAAVLAYWRSRVPYREAVREGGRLWLWFIAAGVGLFAVLIGAHELHDDWDWFPWRLLVVSVMVGWALIGTGVLLGVVRVFHRVSHGPANS